MKEIILDYVKNVTKEKDLDYLFKNLNSQYIADKFKIKRNTVSQYLNEAASKDLVKINTRPVLFLHREEFIKRFFYLSKQSYSSIQELLSEENQNIQIHEDIFQNIVGYNGSLKRPIEQMSSSILYPAPWTFRFWKKLSGWAYASICHSQSYTCPRCAFSYL